MFRKTWAQYLKNLQGNFILAASTHTQELASSSLVKQTVWQIDPEKPPSQQIDSSSLSALSRTRRKMQVHLIRQIMLSIHASLLYSESCTRTQFPGRKEEKSRPPANEGCKQTKKQTAFSACGMAACILQGPYSFVELKPGKMWAYRNPAIVRCNSK